MIKKTILIYFLILSYSLMESEEVYGLKSIYEVKVELDGSDKTSIEEGMREALKTLMVKMTGSTDVILSSKLNKLYRNPEKYISQYKLMVSDEVINANFFFEGNKIRNFLSDNQLPLWLLKESVIMAYIPCELESSIDLFESWGRDKCNDLKQDLSSLSEKRIVELVYPILDFKDLNYLDSLSSISYSAFMNKTIKRYSLENWIVCFIRDDFGVILDKASCISSVSKRAANLDQTFNSLINSINSRNSLIVNKKERTKNIVSIEGVVDYFTLEKVTEELKSQIIVTGINLDSINKSSIEFELFTYGSAEDLKNLLDINSNFIQLENSSENKLIYKFVEI